MKIVLFKSKGIIGTLIRWQSRGQFSHAALLAETGEVFESREFIGVRKLPSLRDAIQKGDVVEVFDIPSMTYAQKMHVIRFCESHLGKKYDYVSVLRFVSRRKESRASRSKWFCSELVFDALKDAGVLLFAETHGWEVSPDLLRRSPLVKRAE